MKRFKDKKLSSMFIIMTVIIVLIIISLIVITSNDDNDIPEDEYLGWMEGIVPNDYMNVNNFESNTCGLQYYTSLFHIKNNKLYDYSDNLLGEKMFSIMPTTYGDCNIQLMFVTDTEGDVYYINNLKDSSLDKLELVKLEEVKEIVRVDVNSDNQIIGYDKDDSETDMTELLYEIENLDDLVINKK